MDTVAWVIVGVVVLLLLTLGYLYRTGRFAAGRARRDPGLAGRNPAADAARTGEGDPARSARSAAVGTERPGPRSPPPADERRDQR